MRILKIIIGIVVFVVLFVCVDFIGIRTLERPIFAKEEKESYVYRGLFYDTYVCPQDDRVKIKLKGSKFSCKIGETSIYGIDSIVDTTKEIEGFMCAEALEKFYEDERYEYYFSCMKSKYIVVRYTDGSEESVEDALRDEHISILDLDSYGIKYYLEEKE